MSRTDVLIVGAGPTGLTLACQLARLGVAFELIEAAPGPQPGSRGKGVQPRTLEVFDDLGIVGHVLAHGQMNMPTRSVAPDGAVTLSNTQMPAARPEVPYASSLITPEWRVEEALRLCLAAHGGAVAFGTALSGFRQTDDGVVATVVTGGEAREISARYLVGCDGGHSVVRKGAGIGFTGETREEVRMIVADVAVTGMERDAWTVWRHEEGMVSLCPLPSTELFQFQAAAGPGTDTELSLDNMQAILQRRTGGSDIRLQAVEWSSLWRANIRLADRYRQGCVFIAGDAAHIHSPAGGQGMNTGIQDAVNLGWKLAAVLRGADEDLLDTYEAERRPVAEGVLALSNARLQEAIAQKGIPTRRDASTMQLGVGYRGSSLACDDRGEGAGLRAGDRAPDATGLVVDGEERRLFELLRGGRFVLLAFGAGDAVKVGAQGVVDRDGHLRSAYGAGEGALVLVRPDGYVGVISDAGDMSVVEGYLKGMGLG